MKLRPVGFFNELEHGDQEGPSLRSAISEKPHPDEMRILEYLNNGHLLIASPGVVGDYFNDQNNAVACPEILTDGTWMWPGDLAYYVRAYHVELPAPFLAHMRARKWNPPEQIDVGRLEL